MDKLSKNILKHLMSTDTPSKKIYDFQEDLENIADSVHSDTETIRAAIRYLHNEGFIDYINSSTGRVAAFGLAHKGLHEPEFSREARREFWRRSIWTPILVTVATTVVLDVIKALLPQILKWVSNNP